jgi:hypothetical protein
MANWYGTARSNYFRVNNPDTFREEMDALEGIAVVTREIEGETRYGILETGGEGWPYSQYNEETQVYDDVDIGATLMEHLADGEVCVLIEAGAEKHRSITGHAIAFNNKGDEVSVALNEIYDRAAALGTTITRAEY